MSPPRRRGRRSTTTLTASFLPALDLRIPNDANVRPSQLRSTVVGVALASLVLGTWLVLHIWAIFFFEVNLDHALAVLALIAIQTWLSSGLFIIAHDAMHGSLAPPLPWLNRLFGRVVLVFYAFFVFDKVTPKHHLHHRHPGREGDPDFLVESPRAFWAWYISFFKQYFSWYQLGAIATLVVVYMLVLHAPLANVLLFWALPSILSSVQLFTFGTWLPHRHAEDTFCDQHNARSIETTWLPSLLACYHFGYHVDHHLSPATPWWGLPRARKQRMLQRGQS